MMNNQDIRWQQRLSHYLKAFELLNSAIAIKNPSIVERAGLIQFFEMAFELAWKLLKDYLEAEGYTIKSPRDAIKQAFQSGIIIEGHQWMAALEGRNLTTHTYNETTALAVEQSIRHKYYPLLEQLQLTFKRYETDLP
jgi:nucleotidyltransferase substrate binding protein (TIGR01987 family)